ncbi:MAG TPA: SCO family protein [Caldithrix abyssi]|uniref:SCO family protein n=1 Tax=Caldithrix abyssi TaxID=187145 RepID=A0A7V1LMF0_CALAY|nr:SCO family protein [Caldithrix abyssi]
MKSIKILFPLTAVIVAIALFMYVRSKVNESKGLPELYEVPAFEYTDQFGERITNDVFKDHISVVDFIFTNCPGLCPMMASRMTRFYDDYENDPSVRFISFSVDPARDSLAAIKEYAQRYEANDKRWLFLRTDSTINAFYEHGFKLGGELPRGHSGAFILVDQNGIIRGYYDSNLPSQLEALNEALQRLRKEL